MYVSFGFILVLAIFGNLLLLLKRKTKLIKFWTLFKKNEKNFACEMHYLAAAERTNTSKLSELFQQF